MVRALRNIPGWFGGGWIHAVLCRGISDETLAERLYVNL